MCGAPAPRLGAKFCDHCGKQLESIACGSQVSPDTSRSRSPRREVTNIQLDASEEEVQIGHAIDVQHNEVPLETAFSRMRMALFGEAMACGVVKTEPPEEMAIPVGQTLYSQWTCAGTFGGGPYAGRPLHEATADLIRGALDPLQHDWLVLDVVKRGSRLVSVDNRRLYCLKS